jgi:bifunctional non-homologous end joining protein LigD
MSADRVFEWIPPMKTGSGGLDRGTASGWAAELKWDGIRASLATDGQQVLVRSSTGRDITNQFPELAVVGPQIGTTVVLDGELVVFDDGSPSFRKILSRLNSGLPAGNAERAHFVAFDLLILDQHRVVDLPYRTRRSLLADLDLQEATSTIIVSPFYEDGAEDLLDVARQRELEGIVIKRLSSPYQSGVRSPDWRKLKIRRRQEFVVGGWLPGQGSLDNDIGSLVLGVWDGPALVMVGSVGSGLRDDDRRRLAEAFVDRTDTPFQRDFPLERPPVWVEPTVVVEAEFSEWTDDGHLRHPVYIGTRHDVDPATVRREPIHG